MDEFECRYFWEKKKTFCDQLRECKTRIFMEYRFGILREIQTDPNNPLLMPIKNK